MTKNSIQLVQKKKYTSSMKSSRYTSILSLIIIIVSYITTVSILLLDTTVAAQTTTITNNTNNIINSTFISNDSSVIISMQANTIQSSITFDMTYIGSPTWISIGFTTTGKMIGSTAVIGRNTNNIQFYNMLSKETSGTIPIDTLVDDTTVLSDTIFLQNSTHTYMKFTRPFSINSNNIPDIYVNSDTNSNNMFMYAYGYDNNGLGMHADRDTFIVKLTSCTTSEDCTNNTIQVLETPYKTLWIIHGLCMVLAWIIIIPFGIGASRLRTIIFSEVWFTIHRTMNMIGILLTIIGFVIAIIATTKSNTKHFTSNIHQKIGLTISILAIVQAISGILRPHGPKPITTTNTTTTTTTNTTSTALTAALDNNTTEYFVNDDIMMIDTETDTENNKLTSNKDTSSAVSNTNTNTNTNTSTIAIEEKSKQRFLWELFHHIIGITIVVIAIYNCYTGLNIYEKRYDTNYDTTLSIIIGIIVGPLLVVSVFVVVRDNFFKK